MATRYVRKSGLDTNGGTSPSDAWLTIGKALGATGLASGDLLYIGAGTYREQVTVNMTSATVETKLVADVDGTHCGDVGEVIWTAWTTNDSTVPSSSPALALNTRDFLTFEGITFVGGPLDGSTVNGASLSTDLTFRRCIFVGGGQYQNVRLSIVATAAVNYLFENCIFFIGSNALDLEPTNPVADYDANIIVRNCIFLYAKTAVLVNIGGANTGRMGGVQVINCVGHCPSNFFNMVGTSTTYPGRVYGCIIFDGNAAIVSNQTGGIVEDYNLLVTSAARSNTAIGTNSKSGQAAQLSPLMEVGQSILRGAAARFPLTPTAGSPLLGYGSDATYTTTTDMLGRGRPEGGASTSKGIGPLERHETGVQSTAQSHTGSNSLALTGPASHRVDIPVDSTVTTVSVWGRYDTNHGTTNKPQMKVVNGTECGVADQTATMTVTTDTWEQMTLTIAPTANGVISLELVSRAAAGNGIAYFDDVAVS